MFRGIVLTFSSISKLKLFRINILKKETFDDYNKPLKTSSSAIASDWKKIGNDMRKGIIKYDRSIAKQG